MNDIQICELTFLFYFLGTLFPTKTDAYMSLSLFTVFKINKNQFEAKYD